MPLDRSCWSTIAARRRSCSPDSTDWAASGPGLCIEPGEQARSSNNANDSALGRAVLGEDISFKSGVAEPTFLGIIDGTVRRGRKGPGNHLLTRTLTICVTLTTFGLGSLAQQPLNTRHVLVSVTDLGGDPVSGLGPPDFVIEENGQAREPLDVRSASYPIVVLLDTSLTARSSFIAMRQAVSKFGERLHGRSIALSTFGGAPARVVSFSDESPDVTHAVEGLFARPGAESQLLDGIIDAAREIRELNVPLSMIVVVSAGAMDQSRRSAGDVLRPVLASHSMVHVIETRSPRGSGRLRRPRLNLGNTTLANDGSLQLEELLQALAARTRGHYEKVSGDSGFESALHRLATRLSAEVVVEYIVPDEAPPSRDLRIGVNLAGASVWGLGLDAPPAP